jgi:hypothetical protein
MLTITLRHCATTMALIALALAGCGGDDDTETGPFELSSSPEFVNMIIPGRRPVALVTATGAGDGAIQLAAITSIDGATAEIVPTEIRPGEVAEIWVELPDVEQETPLVVTVDGTRGGDDGSVTIAATAMPGSDDLGPMATEIAGVFIDELAGSVELLPATTAGLTAGTPVGGLLVVSHYAWFTDTAEIGLAWHIMVAPDDWAELTIRPRDELAPTEAYRLGSWSTALAGGDIEIEAIAAPIEVTR